MPTAFELYRVTGKAGNVGMPGSPILHFDLLVNSMRAPSAARGTSTKPLRRRAARSTSTTSPGRCASSFSVAKSPWWWRSRERIIDRYRLRRS